MDFIARRLRILKIGEEPIKRLLAMCELEIKSAVLRQGFVLVCREEQILLAACLLNFRCSSTVAEISAPDHSVITLVADCAVKTLIQGFCGLRVVLNSRFARASKQLLARATSSKVVFDCRWSAPHWTSIQPVCFAVCGSWRHAKMLSFDMRADVGPKAVLDSREYERSLSPC